MEGWQVGLIAVVVIGLGLIAFGAIRDRRLNERRRREMLAPPDRDIPRFSPDAPTPNYLSELQARRPPAGTHSTELTEDERAELRAAIKRPDTTSVEAGYASADLITDATAGWVVLPRPDVVISAAPVSAIRELLGVLERQVPTGRPLVIVAPSISRELISTFEVNHIQQVVTILPVIASNEAVRQAIAAATGSAALTHADLQSGFIPPGALGSCATWVATATQSHLIAEPAARVETDPTESTNAG